MSDPCACRNHAGALAAETAGAGEGDLTVLARRYEWDMDAVWQSLLSWLDAQPRSVRTRPSSASLQTLLKQAWLAATLAEMSRSAAYICLRP
jgi:hypothetical protein